MHELTNIPAEINRLHSEILAAARTTIQKAIRIGELLVEAKQNAGHGNWLPWIKADLEFSERTATNYMRVYENRDRLKSANVADLTGAYVLIADKESPAIFQKLVELLNVLDLVAYRQRNLLKTHLKLLQVNPDFLASRHIDTLRKLCDKSSALIDELEGLSDFSQLKNSPQLIEIAESFDQILEREGESIQLGTLIIREFIELGLLQPDALQKVWPRELIEFLQPAGG
jgi:hypothetical protein